MLIGICPVSAFSQYLVVWGLDFCVLFRCVDSSPLGKHQFWMVTPCALARHELSGVKLGTHSFRIDIATMAATMGYSAPANQRLVSTS